MHPTSKNWFFYREQFADRCLIYKLCGLLVNEPHCYDKTFSSITTMVPVLSPEARAFLGTLEAKTELSDVYGMYVVSVPRTKYYFNPVGPIPYLVSMISIAHLFYLAQCFGKWYSLIYKN